MENKTQLLIRLLEEKKITFEEAKLLAESDKEEVQFIPYQPIPYPTYPMPPFVQPWQYEQPYHIYCAHTFNAN